MFVIRLMARVVVFLGRASGRAQRTSVVNTALSYAIANSLTGDETEAPLATPDRWFVGVSRTRRDSGIGCGDQGIIFRVSLNLVSAAEN
jgi:hypothetical protein